MRSHQVALVLGFGAVVACGVAADREPGQSTSDSTGGGGANGAAPASASAQDIARSAEMQSTLAKNGRTIDRTTYRVTGGKNTPDMRTQIQKAMLAHRAATTTPKPDWNVPTGAPVRTGVAAYGDGWTSASNNDQIAFAVDSTDHATSPGIQSGTTVTPTTAVKNSTLFVLDNLYGSGGGPGTAPRLIYYNNNASTFFGLSSLAYNVNSTNVQLYALDTTANLWCYRVPENPASPPVALTAQPNCAGWTSDSFATTGAAVTWSSPYPIYDGGSGDIIRMYFTDDTDKLSCVALGETASPTAPASCFTATAAAAGAIAGPPAVAQVGTNQYVIYFGDESCNFYQVLDNNGTLTFNATNTACLGTNTGTNGACTAAQTATKCQVHSSPVIDFTNNEVYVAANARVYQFPLATTSTLPAWHATANDALGSAAQPIDATPAFDENNAILYVSTNNTLYSMAYPLTGAAPAAATLFKAPTANYTIDALTINTKSMPLGSPFTYYNSVFVNSSFGGSTTAVPTATVAPAYANGALEQFAGATSGTSPSAFEQVTSSKAGTMIETGEVIDWENGNVYFGYDNGNSAAGASGGGGLVQYGASASVPNTSEGWSCPNPPFTTSGSTCVYTSGTTSPSCRNTADCTGNANFGAGYVCTNQGSNPGYQCVKTIVCGKSSRCTTANGAPSGATTCDLTATDPSYGTCVACSGGCAAGTVCDTTSDSLSGTCVACDSASQTDCTTSGKTACDYTTGSASFDTCVQCSANDTTTCTTSGLTACDTTAGSTDFDKCVQCSANNTSTCTTAGLTVCDTASSSSKFDKCVECDAANPTCASGVCDLVATDSTYDTCVACAPANGTSNSTCTAANAAFPICISFDGAPSCGQCTTGSSCPLGACGSDGHCVCNVNGGTTGQCPSGSTCSQPSPPALGECE